MPTIRSRPPLPGTTDWAAHEFLRMLDAEERRAAELRRLRAAGWMPELPTRHDVVPATDDGGAALADLAQRESDLRAAMRDEAARRAERHHGPDSAWSNTANLRPGSLPGRDNGQRQAPWPLHRISRQTSMRAPWVDAYKSGQIWLHGLTPGARQTIDFAMRRHIEQELASYLAVLTATGIAATSQFTAEKGPGVPTSTGAIGGLLDPLADQIGPKPDDLGNLPKILDRTEIIPPAVPDLHRPMPDRWTGPDTSPSSGQSSPGIDIGDLPWLQDPEWYIHKSKGSPETRAGVDYINDKFVEGLKKRDIEAVHTHDGSDKAKKERYMKSKAGTRTGSGRFDGSVRIGKIGDKYIYLDNNTVSVLKDGKTLEKRERNAQENLTELKEYKEEGRGGFYVFPMSYGWEMDEWKRHIDRLIEQIVEENFGPPIK